jgi:hypothetical protein
MKPDEMESLNLDDLDIEELEERLELASIVVSCPGKTTTCPVDMKTCYALGPVCEADFMWKTQPPPPANV